jgi:hypothetical protein
MLLLLLLLLRIYCTSSTPMVELDAGFTLDEFALHDK